MIAVISLKYRRYTLQQGRKAFPYRATLTASQVSDASQQLQRLATHVGTSWPKTPAHAPSEVLLFPGQNITELFGMARVFYNKFHKFRSEVDTCLEILSKLESHINIKPRVMRVLLAEPGEYSTEEKIPTNVAQPSLFIFQYPAHTKTKQRQLECF